MEERGDGNWLRTALLGPVGPMASTYEERKVDRTEVDGLMVSTAFTDDFGYETAVCDARVHPVERYASRKEAVAGHAKWVAAVPGLTEITELGTQDGWVGDRQVALVRGQR